MILKTIPSKWLSEEGLRLSARTYQSHVREAKDTLSKLATEPLEELTIGGRKGIFNGPRFARQWVEKEENGKRLLSGSIIKSFEHRYSPIISNRQVESMPEMVLKKGTSLITSYGTVGNTAFVRDDMENFIGSDNVMKVVPDPNKIEPGFLYAYLSSKFGVPIIISGQTGGTVPFLPPTRMYQMRIPRLGQSLEAEVSKRVFNAARLRSDAMTILDDARCKIERLIGVEANTLKKNHESSFAIGEVSLQKDGHRLDAFHYVGYVKEGRGALKDYVLLNSISEVMRPPLMKRMNVTDGGVGFIGGSELHTLEQNPGQRISLKTPSIESYLVTEGMVLFQCVGQRYGIFGKPILSNRRIIGQAVTEHVMRVIPFDKRDAGFLSLYFSTNVGRRNVLSWSAGTSIPVLQEYGAKKIRVFWPEDDTRWALSKAAEEAWEKRCLATELEEEAVKMVEDAIEAAAPKH